MISRWYHILTQTFFFIPSFSSYNSAVLGAFCLVSFVGPRLDSFLFRKNGIQVSWFLIQYFLYYALLPLFNYSFWNNFRLKQKICKNTVSFTQLRTIINSRKLALIPFPLFLLYLLIGILSYGRTAPCLYLFSCSCISIWIYRCLFYSIGYSPLSSLYCYKNFPEFS